MGDSSDTTSWGGIEEVDQISDADVEIVRDALEKYMDDRSTNADRVLRTLETLYPDEGYWPEEVRER
jgi:hypothetical protein